MSALKLNGRQMAALHLLNRATHIATTSGLFDSVDAADAITPRTINEFCDGLGEMTKDLPFGGDFAHDPISAKLNGMAADLDTANGVIDGSSEAYTPEQICDVLSNLAMDCRTLARGEIPAELAVQTPRS